MIWLFLTGGLFLGWSLGANDAANVFGSAVGSRMIRFRNAAITCSVFVVLGAVLQGSGGAATLNELGAVGELQQAFMLALAAAVTVTGMSVIGLPVSTSQAIVGAIIGWNIYAGLPTDSCVLTKILLTWLLCPLLAASFAIPLYGLLKMYLRISRTHLLKQDAMLRWALLAIGAFGSYSLGANNIANVMGVFVPAVGWPGISIGSFSLSGSQQLFFFGALAISLGVWTFSRRTMKTIGGKLFKLTPESALIVVLSHSLVLFVFSSAALSDFIAGYGLPRIPLVPVSSSQAIVGAIIGLGIAKGGYGVNFRVLGDIGLGWLATPIISGLISLGLLYFWN